MSLRKLARTVDDDAVDNDDPFANVAFARAWEMDRLQPNVTPLHPDWTPTVYYDPAKFPVKASLDRIERHYAATFLGRRYNLEALPADQLKRSSIVKFSEADELFRRRGFVSDIEVVSFGKGEWESRTIYCARNRAAVYFQLAVIEHLLQPRGAPPKGSERYKATLAMLVGQRLCDNKVEKLVPLIERDGVLLPCCSSKRVEMIHYAHHASLSAALKHGHDDPAGLCYATSDDLRAQIQFERRNSLQLFSGAKAAALLLWQAQALAMLRKVTWQIEFFEGPLLNAQQTREANERRKALEQLRQDVSLTDAGSIASALEMSLDTYNNKHFPFQVKPSRDVSTGQTILAAFNGSTYRPQVDLLEKSSVMDPINWLQPLAEWICDLKRLRYAVLGEDIVGLLQAVFAKDQNENLDHPPLSRYAPMIQDRLGDVAWKIIAAALLDMQQRGATEAIPVVYEWTRNADEPWAAERRTDGTIVIRGPLLDFPVSQADYWNGKSRILLEERGLAFSR